MATKKPFASSGTTETLYILVAQSLCLPYISVGHNRVYLAAKLTRQSGHGALALNHVHAVPCEVMYIALH